MSFAAAHWMVLIVSAACRQCWPYVGLRGVVHAGASGCFSCFFDALRFWVVPCFLGGLCVPCLLTLGPARLVVDGWQGGVQSSVSCWGPVRVGVPRQLSQHGGGLLLATWRSRQAATFAALAVQLAALHACRPPDPAGCAAPRPGWKPLALQVSADVGVGFVFRHAWLMYVTFEAHLCLDFGTRPGHYSAI